MKKRTLRMVAMIFATLMMLLVFVACDIQGVQGPKGEQGIAGENGKTPQLRINATTNMWEVSYDDGTTWVSMNVVATGVTGTPGTDGKDGTDGAPGTNGQDGITPQLRVDDITNMWEVSYDNGTTWKSLNVSATGTPGTDGKDGVDGAPGANGQDGANGKDGKDGVTPQLRINSITKIWEVSYDNGTTWKSLNVSATGTPGTDGKDGEDGTDGKNGQDGKDGVSVTDAYVDANLHLWLMLSNGNKIDAGYVGVTVTPDDSTPAPITYTVTFTDYDGTVLKTETVESGTAATAPTNPTRSGYRFTGWDKTYDNITSNLTITAQYIQQFTVTFTDYNGTVLKTETVDSGKNATAPVNPAREGYTFAGWDTVFTNVTANLTVTATYTQNVTDPTFIVENVTASAGDTVTVNVQVKNNPGVLGMSLRIGVDDNVLSFVSAEKGSVLPSFTLTAPGASATASPYHFIFDAMDITEADKADGVILTLTFAVKDTATAGTYDVTLAYTTGDIFDTDFAPITFEVVNGTVTVQ